ncbi:hypothetical protein PNQ92_10960, partial [Halobacterium salinarum]|uniref:hypothetical protein n=1 Tax=Halobacterium salinarum TaxID=2242 RepID=UPI002554FF0C
LPFLRCPQFPTPHGERLETAGFVTFGLEITPSQDRVQQEIRRGSAPSCDSLRVVVVEMSAFENAHDRDNPICEFCGCTIDYPERRCAALKDGRCKP